MDYFIAAIIVLFCVAAIAVGLRVLKDTRKWAPPKAEEEEEEGNR